MRALFILGAVLVLAAAAQAQQMYRWTDKDGRIHYTQTPPPAEAKNIQKKALGAGAVDSAPMPYATQVAMKNHPVTLFTSPDCGSLCDEARETLNKRGIPFKETNLSDDKAVEALKRVSGRTTVPTLQVGSQVSVGLDLPAWKNALDAAGYPSSGPPAPAARKSEAAPRPTAALPVKLYTNSKCDSLCQDARDLLKGRGVPFQEIAVEDAVTLDELRKTTGSESVPVLVVGSVPQRGFDATRYNTILDQAGYARGDKR